MTQIRVYTFAPNVEGNGLFLAAIYVVLQKHFFLQYFVLRYLDWRVFVFMFLFMFTFFYVFVLAFVLISTNCLSELFACVCWETWIAVSNGNKWGL